MVRLVSFLLSREMRNSLNSENHCSLARGRTVSQAGRGGERGKRGEVRERETEGAVFLTRTKTRVILCLVACRKKPIYKLTTCRSVTR